jgi:hypothetical protein
MMTVAAADLGNLQKDLIRTFDADTTGRQAFGDAASREDHNTGSPTIRTTDQHSRGRALR